MKIKFHVEIVKCFVVHVNLYVGKTVLGCRFFLTVKNTIEMVVLMTAAKNVYLSIMPNFYFCFFLC